MSKGAAFLLDLSMLAIVAVLYVAWREAQAHAELTAERNLFRCHYVTEFDGNRNVIRTLVADCTLIVSAF